MSNFLELRVHRVVGTIAGKFQLPEKLPFEIASNRLDRLPMIQLAIIGYLRLGYQRFVNQGVD